MGNRPVVGEKVLPPKGVEIKPTSEDNVDQAIEAFEFLRIHGFSVYDEKGEKDGDSSGDEEKDVDQREEPWQTEVGTFGVSSISETDYHNCQKSDRIGGYTSKYDFNTMDRKYLPNNNLGLKCLRHHRQFVNWDVFSGFSPGINFQMMDHSMNAILHWISQNKEMLCGDSKTEKVSIRDIPVDFACMRGVLASIMELPYFNEWKRKTWGIGAVKFGRTIYLTLLSPDKKYRGLTHHKLAYSGHRFEEYMTYPISRNTFERAREMWIKAALTGLSSCVVGFRKNLRFVNQIHEISTQDLLYLDISWSPNRCINSLNDILGKIREFVTEEKVYYRMYFTSRDGISFMKTRYPVNSILPDWFLQEEDS